VSRPSAIAQDARLDAVFSALADPTRRRIVAQLARGPATIGELAEPHAMTLPAVSKHVRVLERAGLLRREREGWYHRCSLDARPLEGAVSFITRYRPFWEDTLEQLARHVEGAPGKKGRKS
jgi:DNA-binding transcriptional ArsR family regulator